MKTYAEKKRSQHFDWNKFLSKNCSKMTAKEVEYAARKSSSWITCAVGNQCAIIPRYSSNSEPIDRRLSKLGNYFFLALEKMRSCIDNKHDYANDKIAFKEANSYRAKAIIILRGIEKRSSELIESEVMSHVKMLNELGYKVVKTRMKKV